MKKPLKVAKDELTLDGVALSLVADKVGTPTYVYSGSTLTDRFQALERALGRRQHLVCYSVKANSTQAVLGRFAELGSGFDIVSAGELYRVLRAGGDVNAADGNEAH